MNRPSFERNKRMKKNVELPRIKIGKIRKAFRHIKQDFRRFDMSSWGYRIFRALERSEDYPPCGTRACFGGWLVFLEKPERARAAELNYGPAVYDRARKIAGFTEA